MNTNFSFLCTMGFCAASANAQSSIAIYGLMDTGVTYIDRVAGPSGQSGSQWSMHPGAMWPSRLGFRGTEELGGGMKAVFSLEGGINSDVGAFQGGLPFGRTSTIGLETPYGDVHLGTQSDYLDEIGVMTSRFMFSGQSVTLHGLDRTSPKRTSNAIRFNSRAFGGFSMSAIFGLGETAGASRAGSARGLAANYESGRLRVAAGYYESRTGETSADAGYRFIGARSGAPGAEGLQGVPGSVALRTFTLAGAWQWGPARLMGSYSQVEQPLAVAGGARSLHSSANSRVQTLDAGISYAVTPRLSVSTSLIHGRMSFVAAPKGSATQWNIGLDYLLSKRTDLYATAGHQSSSDMNTPGMDAPPGGGRSQRLARVGIRHRF